jgi:hypothetical protein
MAHSRSTSEMPGPGNYNAGSTFGKGIPSAKIGIKYKQNHDNGLPGPG